MRMLQLYRDRGISLAKHATAHFRSPVRAFQDAASRAAVPKRLADRR